MPDTEMIKVNITLIVYLGLENVRLNVDAKTPIKTKPVKIAISGAGKSNINGTSAQAKIANISIITLEITEAI